MGMFDWITVHKSFIADDEPGSGWQTKGLNRDLAQYELGKDGFLKWKSGTYSIRPPEPYTGILHFYTSVTVNEENRLKQWREYKCRFRNGQLIKIEPVYE